MSTGKVYVIIDSRDGSKRYVGETKTTLKARLAGHISAALNGLQENGRSKWGGGWNARHMDLLTDIMQAGLMPVIELLEEVPHTGITKEDKRARLDAEVRWVSLLRAQGHDLTNGVSGVPKGYVFAEGTGARKLKGRKRPELAAALTGREMSEEHCENIAKATQARWDRDKAAGVDRVDHDTRVSAAKRAWATRRANGSSNGGRKPKKQNSVPQS